MMITRELVLFDVIEATTRRPSLGRRIHLFGIRCGASWDFDCSFGVTDFAYL